MATEGEPFIAKKEDESETQAAEVHTDRLHAQPNLSLSANVNSLASLRNVERRQQRREVNRLVSRLDGMLSKT